MALVFVDSFDHYATADITSKWTSITNDPTIDASGRFVSCLAASGNNRYVQKTVPSLSTYICGFAFKASATPTAEQVLIAFRDGTVTHVDLRLNSVSRLSIYRSTTFLATGTVVLAPATWYYVEVKIIVSDTVGLMEVMLNGVLDVSYYGAGSAGSPTGDTRNAANGIIDNFQMGVVGNSQGMVPRFDDFYLLNTSGGSPTNTYLGDIRVEALFPNGNGNSSQFDGSDGNQVDNYLLVDETTAGPDDDTTYVESADVGDKDTYAFTNMSTGSGTVYGVQLGSFRRKTDAGSRTAVSVARLSGTETDGTAVAALDSYTYAFDIREAKPGGGVWTVTDVNAAEFGFKVNS